MIPPKRIRVGIIIQTSVHTGEIKIYAIEHDVKQLRKRAKELNARSNYWYYHFKTKMIEPIT